MFLLSKPLRLRGLKYKIYARYKHRNDVEAFAASWIEIVCIVKQIYAGHLSKPLRLRGLKLKAYIDELKLIRRSLCGFVD